MLRRGAAAASVASVLIDLHVYTHIYKENKEWSAIFMLLSPCLSSVDNENVHKRDREEEIYVEVHNWPPKNLDLSDLNLDPSLCPAVKCDSCST